MRKWVLLLAVLVVAPVAAASPDAPDGFRESVRLTPRVQVLSGNPAAVVYCARTSAAFNAKLREVFGPEAPRAEAFTVYADNAAYFQAYTCSALERWIRGKPATRYEVGLAAHTLAHEAEHLRGVVAEKPAECRSLATLARTLRVHFAVKNPVANKAMVAAARKRNSTRSAYAC